MTPFHFFWDKKFSKASLGFIFSSILFLSFSLHQGMRDLAFRFTGDKSGQKVFRWHNAP